MALMKERIWIRCVGQRACVSAFHPDTDPPLHDECVIAFREELNPSLRPLLSSG